MAWPQNGRSVASAEQTPGVIETIGNAFVLLNKQPYVLVFPILLDLFLWLGVRLSVQPLIDALIRWTSSSPSMDEATISRLNDIGKSVNLFELLALSMPSLVTRVGADAIAGASNNTIDTLSWWQLLLVGLLLFLVGYAIGVFYLTLLGFLVRNERLGLKSLPQATFMNIFRAYGYLLLLVGVSLLILFPLLILSSILLAIGISVVALLSLLLVFAFIWAYVLLFFVKDAIVVSAAGPARAIYLSYNVVRANFWPCIGLIFVSLLVKIGTPLALLAVTRSPFGGVLAFIVNSYILTGVILAAMLFYRDRAVKLRAPQLPLAPDRLS
jgi:hypothetical protein